MAGFDDPGVFYSESLLSEGHTEDGDISRMAAQRRFKEFIKTFLDHENVYSYRYGGSLYKTSALLIPLPGNS